jgi:hypothetical protein
MTEAIVIIGGGPAGREAAALLPDARVIARPAETAWHAEAGRVWIEGAAGVQAVPFARLLLCADEPLLLLALGCAFVDGRPVVDAGGATSVPGVFAAGRVLGAGTKEEAMRQARIAAAVMAGATPDGAIRPVPVAGGGTTVRLDPLAIAELLERPASEARNQAALAQMGARGGLLTGLVAPARPVGFAALAALATSSPASRPAQTDDAVLEGERGA